MFGAGVSDGSGADCVVIMGDGDGGQGRIGVRGFASEAPGHEAQLWGSSLEFIASSI